ncbi:MAG: MBL fold metallo-hydrolase [Bacteroidales bacterium]|nr:MBL fold metallo-hydrolase [Bacteroidales bacterium]
MEQNGNVYIQDLKSKDAGYGKPIKVNNTLYYIKLKMPSMLDHVQIWLIKDFDKWVLVDTGLNRHEHKEVVSEIIDNFCGGKLSKVIVTHFHVDHIGLAGWICEKYNVELNITEAEWLTAMVSFLDIKSNFFNEYLDLLKHLGIRESDIILLKNSFKWYNIYPLPRKIKVVQEGEHLEINGENWKSIICQGHSPAQLCLFNQNQNLLICGDHLMSHLVPVLGFLIYKPETDLLGGYLRSFEKLQFLNANTLVLPAHGDPFFDPINRMQELSLIFNDELNSLLKRLNTPQTLGELVAYECPDRTNPFRLRFYIEKYLALTNYLIKNKQVRKISQENTHLFQKV